MMRTSMVLLGLIVASILVLPACQAASGSLMSFSLSSSAFAENTAIPDMYTCNGQNISPPLAWTEPPSGTKSLALILHDPDAPLTGGFSHWVIFNIPTAARKLDENVPRQAQLSDGTIEGNNGAGAIGYTGPCPPAGGVHHYNFTLYALDTTLNLAAGANEVQVLAAISGHSLGEAALTGLYQHK